MQQAIDHIKKGYREAITTVIENNPRAVYDYIQVHYPNALQKLIPGVEGERYFKDRMYNLLVEKAAGSGNTAAYTVALLQAIPMNPAANNWTTK